MKQLLLYVLLGALVLGTVSCKKERISLLVTEQTSPTDAKLRDVTFTDSDNGFIVGGDKFDHGELLTTSDGGITWTSDTLADKRLNTICFRPSDQKGFIAGFDSYFLHKDPGASFWSFRNLSGGDEVHGMAFNDTHGVAVGGGGFRFGVIYHFSDDEGNTDTIAMPLDNELRAVTFIEEETVIAVGYGLILRSTDGGINWTPNPIDGDFFYAVSFPASQIGYVVGVYGMILKTEDGGLTWNKLRKARTIGSGSQFRDVFFVSADKGYIAGDRGLLWITDDGADSWKIVDNLPGIDFNAVWSDGQNGFLVGSEGKIFQFTE
ncbi:MAG: YCF48-related protein [Bacteroidota bacterium]